MALRLCVLLASVVAGLGAYSTRAFDPRDCRANPVFVGFDEESFQLSAQPGKVFSLISAPDTQVNMLLVDAELPPTSDIAKRSPGTTGTFMAACGLQYQKQRLEVAVDHLGVLMSVKTNGTELLTLEAERHMGGDIALNLAPGVDVSIMHHRSFYGDSVFFQTPDFDYMLYSTRAFIEEGTGARIHGHLNLQVQAVHMPSEKAAGVGGLLGRTLRKARAGLLMRESSASVTDFSMQLEIPPFSQTEGEAAYVVRDLFARPSHEAGLQRPVEGSKGQALARSARRLLVLPQ